MRSRCMSLLPRTTLHSDSEHYLHICYLVGKSAGQIVTRTERVGQTVTRTKGTVPYYSILYSYLSHPPKTGFWYLF